MIMIIGVHSFIDNDGYMIMIIGVYSFINNDGYMIMIIGYTRSLIIIEIDCASIDKLHPSCNRVLRSLRHYLSNNNQVRAQLI